MTRVLLAAALVAAAVVLAAASVKITGEDQILLVGDGPGMRDAGSGVRLVRPFTPARKYDLAPDYRFSGEDRLAIPLKAGKSARLECTVRGRIDRGKALALFRQYGEELGRKLLQPLLVRELAGDARSAAGAGRAGLDGLDAAGVAGRINAVTRPLGFEVVSLEAGRLAVESGLPDGLERADGFKVFILGLDGVDWKIVDLVAPAHSLPNFERLKSEGAWGNLRSQEPLVSPLIWTTMATGVSPDVHGITDFLVTDPGTGVDIPVTSTMRKVPALWNIATLFGLRSAFVGWFATYPAEEIEGVVVSDRTAYHMFDPSWLEGGRAEAPAALTYPAELLAEIQPLLVEPADVTADLGRYIHGPVGEPGARTDPDDPVSSLRLVLSGMRSYQGITLSLYPRVQPDLAGVYFEFTDSACHLFMRYMEPAQPGVTPAEAARYGDGVAAAYLDADRILGRVLDMLDDRTVLVVISDHGFKSGDIRPMSDSRIGHGQAVSWHRMDGVIALRGPAVKPGHRIVDAGVLDVAPTVLHLLGLPVGEEMPGKVLAEALDDRWAQAHPVRRTTFYQSLAPGGAAAAAATAGDQALRDKLAALGYVAGGNTALVNMANFYQKNGRYAEAIEVWKQLLEADPDDLGARVGMSNAYFETGQHDLALGGLSQVLAADPRNGEALKSQASLLVRLGRGQEALASADRALGADPQDGMSHLNRGLALELLGRPQEATAAYKEAARLAPDLAEAHANLAQMYLAGGLAAEGLSAARTAVDLAPNKPEMQYVLGQALEASGKPDEALGHFRASLRIDPAFSGAYLGAANVMLTQGKPDSAVAICARGLASTTQYLQYLHHLKGLAHLALDDFASAGAEFRSALEADRGFLPARLKLAAVYLEQGKRGDARRELEAVLAADPSNREARALLERASR